jgi:glutamine cyclotransferase
MPRHWTLAALFAAAAFAFGSGSLTAQSPGPVQYTYSIVHAYPHDAHAFTQGLLMRDGVLYESTGLNGQSSLRKVQLETGKVLSQVNVPSEYFAEGLTDWNSRLFQLTWQTKVGFVYDLATFRRERTFSYQGEGWGLTHDARTLIMSDGTERLRRLSPDTLGEVGQILVRDKGMPVKALNELEFVRGEIFANVWQTDRICRIDPSSGRVTGWIDLAGLLTPAEREAADVLNGIAYDAGHDRLFVTGKNWPHLFEIQLQRKPAA